jgi:hypothetical protein
MADRGQDADDVSVPERPPSLDPLQVAAAPDERAVDASAVDDRPRAGCPLEDAVLCAGDEVLGIGTERDVVQLGQASDGEPLARQLDRLRLGFRSRDDDRCD